MQADKDFLIIFFIYSLRAITALFWGVFLYCYRRRSYQNLPLSIIFFTMGMLYLHNCFERLPALIDCDVYNPLGYLMLIFVAPFTIFYAYFSIGEEHSTGHYIRQFIPLIAAGVLWGVVELSGAPHIPFCRSIDELIAYRHDYPLYVGFFLFLIVVFVIQVFTYFSMALRRFLRIRRDYRANGVPLRPLRMLIAMDFLFLIYPLFCGVFYLSYNNSLGLGVVCNTLVSVIITAISVLNINLLLPIRTDVGFMCNPAKKIAPSYTTSVGDGKTKVDGDLTARIRELFENKEIYRLPQLTLQDIASELGTNRSYISACINSHYGCNFKQMLIRYRIDAARKLLLTTSLDVQDIAANVGFNTRASFYNAFRECVSADLTPAEWRRQQGDRPDQPEHDQSGE